MGVPVLILGKSGSGKSTSLRNFPECGVINVLGKPLPFRHAQKALITDNYIKIMDGLMKSKVDSLCIDDAGYLMTNQFMRGHAQTGAGNGIFTFYNTIGDCFWKLIRFVVEQLPENKIVYLMMHEEENDMGETKPKTIGKMLDEKVCVEGMFSIVLRCMIQDGKHVFKTQSDGLDVAKSPMEMFESETIDNDLKMVDETIRKYYNMEEKENGEEKN